MLRLGSDTRRAEHVAEAKSETPAGTKTAALCGKPITLGPPTEISGVRTVSCNSCVTRYLVQKAGT
jgi:hypothetical protein